MAKLPVIAEAPQDENWDVIIVGCGMGGSTLGYSLARHGLKVLFVEKGHYLFGDHDRTGFGLDVPEDPSDRLLGGWWPHKVPGRTSYGEFDLYPSLGCGTGGSTSLYAGQLERFRPSDLVAGRYHAHAREASTPETWPITYEDLLPHYRKAEQLFEVCGTQDPTLPDPESELRKPPAMKERDAALFEYFGKSEGLNPYRAHVACRFVDGCGNCGGHLCPKQCKRDAGSAALQPAVTKFGAKVLPLAEVVRLEADAEKVTGVVVQKNGEELTLRGKVVALSANAWMTPALLLKSRSDLWPNGLANRSDQVGRNLMMHTSDFIAVAPPGRHDGEGPDKSISFNDLYEFDDQKLGAFQTMGIPVTEGAIDYFLKTKSERDRAWYNYFGKFGRKIASKVAARLFQSATVFATIVEDLPYAENRVVLDDSAPDGMRFEYTYPDELVRRNHLMRKELRRRMHPKLKFMVLTNDNNLNYGHIAGTCRSGDDPTTSVVDRDNKAHDLDNLYIADSSAFPTSGGTNPSLTIAANALRVADAIAARLTSEEPVS